MALAHSPKIVTDNLALLLDAGNIKSYPGTGTAWSDLSGNGYNVTLVNGPVYNSADGGSIDFDGTNDYGIINDVIVSSPTALSIGGWFKHNGSGSNFEMVLHHGETTAVGSSRYFFGLSDTDNITATIGAITVGWEAGETTTIATLDTWYFVTATWDGTTVRVYINGNFIKQYSLASYSNITTPTRIGSSGSGTGYSMNGSISDVFIYTNKALTPEEININFNALRGRYGI